MTTTESRKTSAPRPQVAAAAARAYVTIAERSGREIPQWIRDNAAGHLTVPPEQL